MAVIIGAGLSRQLPLTTRQGNQIPNSQSREMAVVELNLQRKLEQDYREAIVHYRNKIAPTYNCHGMTFASRRTSLDTMGVNLVLDEDDYEEVKRDCVLPGDVILYFGERNDIHHSGVVVQPPSESPIGIPLVVSKWGRAGEVIHWGNRGPYGFNVRYYRIKDEQPIVTS